MSRWLGWVPRALSHPLNVLLGIALLAVLVALPLCGVPVSDHLALIGGNWMNGVGYLGASIAAGSSVVNLHEGRKHRAAVGDHLRGVHERIAALHTSLHTAPRGDDTTLETAP